LRALYDLLQYLQQYADAEDGSFADVVAFVAFVAFVVFVVFVAMATLLQRELCFLVETWRLYSLDLSLLNPHAMHSYPIDK
jgi:hypothetical protein